MGKLSRQEIEEKVNEVIVDKLCVEASEVKPEAKLTEDLNADSLDAIELTMEFEKVFGITIDEDMNAMQKRTVADVYNLVESLANAS